MGPDGTLPGGRRKHGRRDALAHAEGSGLACPPLDAALIDTSLNHLIAIGSWNLRTE
jgi:hypothetical protein